MTHDNSGNSSDVKRGKLLYDESEIKQRRKEVKREKLKVRLRSSVLICGSIAMIIYIILDGPRKEQGDCFILCFGAPSLIFIGSYYFINTFRWGYLKVYENGFVHPIAKTFKDGLLGREKFIPFYKIDSFYTNAKHNLPYVTYTGTLLNADGFGRMAKRDIYDFDKFIELIQNKVKVIDEKDWNCEKCGTAGR